MRPIPLPAKTVEISYGEFACPNCNEQTVYKHKERVRRRLVFFVPFLGETIAEYAECQRCKSQFPLDVLRAGLASDTQRILSTLAEKLNSGISVEDMQSTLLESGIELQTVKRYVSVAAGISRKRCPECGHSFRTEVMKCKKCRRILV